MDFEQIMKGNALIKDVKNSLESLTEFVEGLSPEASEAVQANLLDNGYLEYYINNLKKAFDA